MAGNNDGWLFAPFQRAGLAIFLVFFIVSCNHPSAPDLLKDCSYDAGWEDGYDGERLKCRDNEYLSGYDDGEFYGHCEWLKYSRKDRKRFESERCGNWNSY